MPHILPTSANDTINHETGDFCLSFTTPLPGQLSQQKHYKTLHSTQTGRDDLLFTSIIDPLFSFLLSIVEAQGDFSLDHFNIFCLWLN